MSFPIAVAMAVPFATGAEIKTALAVTEFSVWVLAVNVAGCAELEEPVEVEAPLTDCELWLVSKPIP